MKSFRPFQESKQLFNRRKEKELIETLRNIADDLEKHDLAFIDVEIKEVYGLNDRMFTEFKVQLVDHSEQKGGV